MNVHWTHHDIDVDGKRLRVVRTGHGDKPPLVLQHGFTDDGLCWAPTARDLEADYDVLMPEARAHGQSGPVYPGESVDQIAELAALLQALDVKQAIVAGHSMGAGMTAELAARFPELTRAIILEDPPWFMPQAGRTGPGLLGKDSPRAVAMRALQQTSLDELVAREANVHPTWPTDVLRAWCAAKLRFDVTFFEIAEMTRMDWQEVVRAIACPTLLIIADKTQGSLVSPEVAEIAVEMNPLIEVVHIPNVGHHIRFAAYGPYMRAVRAFLSRRKP